MKIKKQAQTITNDNETLINRKPYKGNKDIYIISIQKSNCYHDSNI